MEAGRIAVKLGAVGLRRLMHAELGRPAHANANTATPRYRDHRNAANTANTASVTTTASAARQARGHRSAPRPAPKPRPTQPSALLRNST
ncbi:hypothetical protein GCM10009850_054070 [Nonomuraea monospora]|uniref:Transposase n=1 Tax=Nonomuraea monospora TaxID=568818 RepID=A0ABP5PHE3_9ACTN